jgi:hypothetical protein
MLFGLFRRAIEGHSTTIPAEGVPEVFDLRRLWRVQATSYGAHLRGIRLLRQNLSPVQRQQYDLCGYFEVTGGQTGRRYRIKHGFQMNVEQLDVKGRPVCELCFMPEGGLVIGDVMLAQKLALELFERDALKAANKLSPRRSVSGFLR